MQDDAARGSGFKAEIIAFLRSFFRGLNGWLLLMPVAGVLTGYLARRHMENEWAVWWQVKGT